MDEGQLSSEQWQQVRSLFDAVCDLPSDQWTHELQQLTSDPGLLASAVALLEAQTITLRKVLTPLERIMAKVVEPEVRVGDELGPWRLSERLQGGGMGAVFLAQRADELYQQQVAIKLLPGLPSERSAERLATERRILAGLRHPNVARLYDGGTTPSGQPYLVMEYIDGLPLDQYCKQKALGLSERLRLFQRICAAVQSAHEKLVVHYDLKPSNVLVNGDGEPILLDFGIARLIDGAKSDEKVEFCTPAYASPEMVGGHASGVVGDVFSLGVMLDELLSTRPLGRGAADVSRPVVAPSQWAPASCPWRRRLRGDLDAIVLKACALDPSARYRTVAELADDVRRYVGHHVVRARAGGWAYRVSKMLRRHWVVASMSTAVVLMVGGFVSRLDAARATAEEEALVAQQVSDFLVTSFEAGDPSKRGDPTREVTVREVLDAGAAKIDKELSSAPAQRARLKATLGQAYRQMGEVQSAEPLLREAAETMLDPKVARPVEASHILTDLVFALIVQGRHKDAEGIARRALGLVEGGESNLWPRARAHNALGTALSGQQQFDEAERQLRTSLALRAKLPSGTSPGGATSVKHNLGQLYYNSGKFTQSEAILREALAERLEQGPPGPDYQDSLQSLGMSLMEQGRLAEAADVYRQSMELSQAIFGEESLPTGLAYTELASIHQDMGQYTLAALDYERAIEIIGRVSGKDSVSYAIQLNNFATLEEDRGDLKQAEALFRQSLAIRQKQLGADAPGSLRAESNLGRLLMRAGQLDEARTHIERTLRKFESTVDASSPDLRTSRLGYIEWQIRSGQFDQARAALAAMPPQKGWSARHVSRHLRLEAELAQRTGDPKAVDRWEKVIADAAALQGGGDVVAIGGLRVDLAEALIRQGDREGADAQLALAAPVLRAELVPRAELIRRLKRLQQG